LQDLAFSRFFILAMRELARGVIHLRYKMLTLAIAAIVAMQGQTPAPAMSFSGLGPYHRHISTKNRKAEEFFNQGLMFMYGFNRDEAIRSFETSAKLDSKCAIAYWGIATANGPDINSVAVDPDHAKAATDAIRRALALSGSASPVERALIKASVKRFSSPQPPDRSPLDRAYADEMRKVWKQFPRDSDVGALFAESLMDLTPWNYWKPDGTPQPGIMEIIATCRAVLKIDPNHPQALHLMIHATEASKHPEWGTEAANRLRFLQPGLGHMTHMPSHNDVRTGEWQKAIDSNARALATDYAYRKRRNKLNFYRFYIAHNHEMLAYAAMMIGQEKRSLAEMDAMLNPFTKDQLKDMAPFVDGYTAMPLEARVRFGKWDEILATPELPDYFPIGNALRHYARGVAFAAKGMLEDAKKEQDLLEFGSAAVPAGSMVGLNPAEKVMSLAKHMLQGEIALAENRLPEAISELSLAVKAEDSLTYNEPPDWVMPVRHALGAVLIKAGRAAEAEQVYREDLRRLPKNGWSLFGLSQALDLQGRAADARMVRVQFEGVWKNADIPIVSSCLCVKK
jgi:tetratricopeptide (TPR) repeat protein